MGKSKIMIGVVFVMSVAMALSRVIPHPANFTPITALALAAGAYFGNRWFALLAPLFALFISDLILGFYPGMIFNYLAMASVTILGSQLKQSQTSIRIAGFTFTGTTLFFIVSNFGVWIAAEIYPKTLDGFIACYINAIPFYGYSLIGDLFYASVVFGSYKYLSHAIPALKTLK